MEHIKYPISVSYIYHIMPEVGCHGNLMMSSKTTLLYLRHCFFYLRHVIRRL